MIFWVIAGAAAFSSCSPFTGAGGLVQYVLDSTSRRSHHPRDGRHLPVPRLFHEQLAIMMLTLPFMMPVVRALASTRCGSAC